LIHGLSLVLSEVSFWTSQRDPLTSTPEGERELYEPARNSKLALSDAEGDPEVGPEG